MEVLSVYDGGKRKHNEVCHINKDGGKVAGIDLLVTMSSIGQPLYSLFLYRESTPRKTLSTEMFFSFEYFNYHYGILLDAYKKGGYMNDCK